MCNCYRSTVRLEVIKQTFESLALPLVFPRGAPNLEPLDNIRPTQTAPIIRPLSPSAPGGGVEIISARWDLIPWFWKQPIKAKKFLATNARSETAHTLPAFREAFRRRRCLIPADGFYEWTGEKGSKIKWRFTTPQGGLFCIAGLWDRAETADGPVESFTMLTCSPGPDMVPYHDRQVVIVPPARYADWLDLEAKTADLLIPPPAGALKVERAA